MNLKSIRISKRLLYLIEGGVLVFIGWAIFGVGMNSVSLDSVTVRLTPGGEEYRDKTVLGIGKNEEPPDYQLKVQTTDSTELIGIFANTYIGEGLEFKPQRSIPKRDIIGFQLTDKDTIESDVLEQFPYDEDLYQGENYTFQIANRIDIESGLAWFFKTPVGIAILAGITISIVLIVLYYGGPGI